MNTKQYLQYLIAPGALLILFLLMLTMPIGGDWKSYNVDNVAQLQTPYSLPRFVGMPFAFFALPHSLLSINIGNAINLTLNVLVIGLVAEHYAGKQWPFAFIITLTSPLGINMLMSNNIDWIPLSAFLVADWLAYPLLAMKPNMLAGAALIRFKRNPSPLALMPLLVMLVVSVVVWGDWWQHLGSGLNNVAWNLAPFPFMIPVGLWLLWKAWKAEDEILGACATPFLMPYFAPYSLTGVHVLLACRYRNAAIGLWVFSWWYLIFSIRLAGV